MKHLAVIALASLGLAACDTPNPNRPSDVGTMQPVAPVAGSGITVPAGSVTPQSATGSMQPVTGGAGRVSVPAPTAVDTGSMASPNPGAGSTGRARPRTPGS